MDKKVSLLQTLQVSRSMEVYTSEVEEYAGRQTVPPSAVELQL